MILKVCLIKLGSILSMRDNFLTRNKICTTVPSFYNTCLIHFLKLSGQSVGVNDNTQKLKLSYHIINHEYKPS